MKWFERQSEVQRTGPTVPGETQELWTLKKQYKRANEEKQPLVEMGEVVWCCETQNTQWTQDHHWRCLLVHPWAVSF